MKFTPLFVFLSILVLGCVTAPARADITVMNPSFENGVTLPLATSCGTNCSYNFGPIQGWAMTGTGGLFQPNSTYYSVPVPDGSIVAWSSHGTISQTLTGTSLTSNTTYTLSVDVGHRLDEPLGTNYSISLYAGGTLLASLPPTSSTFDIPIGTFMDETLTFTSGATPAPGDLRIVLSSGNQGNFDDVKLTASTVPEPTSLSLLVGGLGLLLYARRRR